MKKKSKNRPAVSGKARQTKRVGAFDREVRQSVECLLSKLLVEYGNTGTDRRG